MKGFFKAVTDDVKGSMPAAGADAGRSFADGFTRAARSAGQDVAAAVADPLGKSTARLEAEARAAGKALAAAQDEVVAAAGRLEAARKEEETAAKAAASAEETLNRARQSSATSAADVARAEAAHKAAVERSTKANQDADDAAAQHSRALGTLEEASRGADTAVTELARATGRSKLEIAQADPALDDLARSLDKAEREAKEADTALTGTGRGASAMSGMVRSAVGPLLAMAAAVGIGGFASEAITASDATDKFVSTLQFAGLDGATIERLTESAKAYADATVYDLADIQSITSQLAANGVDGFDQLAEAAGNLNAVAGGSAETFSSVGMVLTQTAGQGKLTTENWNQLSDAIPGASGKIQQALLEAGAYTGNFREALEKGEITAEEFNAAVLRLGSDETAVAAARSTKTIEGAAGNLQATLVSGFKEFIDWVKPAVTTAMGEVATGFENAFTWIKQHKQEILALAGGVTVAVAAYAGFSILTKVKAWIHATEISMHALNAAMKANIVGIVITAIAALVTGLILLYQRNEDFRLKVQEMGRAVKAVWEDTIQPAIATVWGWISGTLMPGIQGIIDILFKGDFTGSIFGLEEDSTFVDILFRVRDAAIAVWDWVVNVLAPGVSSAWSNVIWPAVQTVATAIYDAWVNVIWPALSALWSWVTVTLAPALSAFWTGTVQPVWAAISAAVSEAWNSYILPALSALWSWVTVTLAPALSAFWTGTVQPVWTAISGFIQSAWVNVIGPSLSALWSFITGVLVPIFLFLWRNVVQPAFQGIGAIISFAWNFAIKPVLEGWKWMFQNVIGPVITWLWRNVVQPAFQGISTTISTVINFLSDTVFPKIKSAIDNAKNGFDNFRDGVKAAMDKVKEYAAKPVNFVINTVYKDGIKKAFDTIAEKVGLSLRLPDVKAIAGYASGGQWQTMTPGYTPGRDVYHFYSPDGGGALKLSGGEGIIRPDALRALGGKPWLDRVNAWRGRGLANVGDLGRRRGQVAFADGGIWGRVTDTFEAAADWVSSTASAVADIVSDPLGAVANLVIAPAKTLLAQMGSSFWAQTMKATPPLWFESLKNIFKTKTEESGMGSSSGLVGAARKAIGVPYIWGGSSIPPGVDCSGLVYWSAKQLGLGWPRLTAAGYQAGSTPVSVGSAVPGDLLFWGSPAWHVAIVSGPGRMVEAPKPGTTVRETAVWGTPTAGRYGGKKYDAGGWLPPGVTAAVNQTGAREAVLTARQWRDVSSLAAQGVNSSAAVLDGAELRLVIDDGEALDAHIEVVATGASRRAEQLRGRGR
ncbi:tape measure protein [Actinomyces howellii]|nr:tape measure protein [Actinomyces howellii]